MSAHSASDTHATLTALTALFSFGLAWLCRNKLQQMQQMLLAADMKGQKTEIGTAQPGQKSWLTRSASLLFGLHHDPCTRTTLEMTLSLLTRALPRVRLLEACLRPLALRPLCLAPASPRAAPLLPQRVH